jgi:hypothetical protein
MASAIPRRTGDIEQVEQLRLPGITIAAAASLGAGAVLAATAGVHADHPELARIFIVVAAAQLGAGVLALFRPNRSACWAIAGANALAVGGWLLTRLRGIGWIDGLHVRESPQFADTAGATLGAVAFGAAIAAALIGWQQVSSRRTTGAALPALAIVALAIPAMLLGGTHVQSQATAAATAVHDHGAATAGATDAGTTATDATHVHDHDAAATADTSAGAGGTATTVDESQPHVHDAGAAASPAGSTDTSPGASTGSTIPATATDGTPLQSWPRPWDPSQPIDVSGVAGVTPDQEARAAALIKGTLADLPKYADPATAVADGYSSIGDAGTGSEHYIKSSLIQDGDMLDPAAPESLVYDVSGTQRTLAGAMYIVSSRPLTDPSLTSYAGPLMTWHEHNNLCWGVGPDGKPKVVGLTDANGNCSRGVKAGGDTPMVHVWIVPRTCGVFSALEGVGEGNAAVPEDQRTDTCAAETHDHTAATPAAGSTVPANPVPANPVPANPVSPSNAPGATTTTTANATAAVPSLAYDPDKPIDLSGVAGVTPKEQAAAENLVAINVVRLPQWSDYKTAEAAGFHSIGDAATGYEHFINWNWINDKVWLDPDHPESLVYQPQADGSKKLVSAMYMLPDTVALTNVPDIGGALMQWHIHDNLCFTTDPVAPQVAGLTRADGSCPAGLNKFPASPMIHVWIVPNACGPFAALNGISAGQVAPGQTQHCDHLHGDGLLG